MSKLLDLPDIIPVFPLGGALLLPRSRLPLHIFEPRYLSMIDDALKTPERLIGMIQPMSGKGDEDPEALQKIGCAGRISQFSELEDGRYMITLSGISRFRTGLEVEGFQPYRRFAVNWTSFKGDQDTAKTDSSFDRPAFLNLLSRFFEFKDLSTDWDSMQKADDELLVNSLSMLLDFEREEKQALLESPSLANRRETLVTLIEYIMLSGDRGKTIQ